MQNKILSRDMHNPVTRLRGGRLITMHGAWGNDARMRLFIRATLKHPEQEPVYNSLKRAFTQVNNKLCYWFNFPCGNFKSMGMVSHDYTS